MKTIWMKIGFFFNFVWEYMPVILVMLLGIVLILQILVTYHYALLKFELINDVLSY